MRLKLRFLRPREDESARAETVVTRQFTVMQSKPYMT